MNVRTYRMSARAEAVTATRERILDAALALFEERDFGDVPLTDVADRAGTTVQTILRHFESKAGIVDELIRRESSQVLDERDQIAVGDVEGVAAYLATHYGDTGDRVIRMLAFESRSAVAARAVEHGRALHRAWVERTFAPALDGGDKGGGGALDDTARQRRLEQLVAATDVYTWKIMRRDGVLDDDGYRAAITELLNAISGGPQR